MKMFRALLLSLLVLLAVASFTLAQDVGPTMTTTQTSRNTTSTIGSE